MRSHDLFLPWRSKVNPLSRTLLRATARAYIRRPTLLVRHKAELSLSLSLSLAFSILFFIFCLFVSSEPTKR